MRMYKIYINGTRLVLMPSGLLTDSDRNTDVQMVTRYPGQRRYLLNYIDMLEKGRPLEQLIIHSSDYDALRRDWKVTCPTVKAAGGLIVNADHKVLFIYRRGHWDLPKGKMEKGESKRETAVREVIEETGVQGVTITQKLLTTRHLYRGKSGKRFVKKSHWYLMLADHQDLVPQLEEDIVRAEWMTLDQWRQQPEPTYDNIRLVIDRAVEIVPELG